MGGALYFGYVRSCLDCWRVLLCISEDTDLRPFIKENLAADLRHLLPLYNFSLDELPTPPPEIRRFVRQDISEVGHCTAN